MLAEDDIHLCLGCREVIEGLEKYVYHRRFQCQHSATGNKSHVSNAGHQMKTQDLSIPLTKLAECNNAREALSLKNGESGLNQASMLGESPRNKTINQEAQKTIENHRILSAINASRENIEHLKNEAQRIECSIVLGNCKTQDERSTGSHVQTSEGPQEIKSTANQETQSNSKVQSKCSVPQRNVKRKPRHVDVSKRPASKKLNETAETNKRSSLFDILQHLEYSNAVPKWYSRANSDEAENLLCPLCEVSMPNVSRFASHLNSETHKSRLQSDVTLTNPDKDFVLKLNCQYQCHVCNYFEKGDNKMFRKHLRSKEHKQVCGHNSVICSACEWPLKQQDLLKHVSLHRRLEGNQLCLIKTAPIEESSSDEEKGECPYCDEELDEAADLHISRLHRDKLHYRCRGCPSRLPTQRSLNAHYQNFHTQEVIRALPKCISLQIKGLLTKQLPSTKPRPKTDKPKTQVKKKSNRVTNNLKDGGVDGKTKPERKGQKDKKAQDTKAKSKERAPRKRKKLSLRERQQLNFATSREACLCCRLGFENRIERKTHLQSLSHKREVSLRLREEGRGQVKLLRYRCTKCHKETRGKVEMEMHALGHKYPLTEKKLRKVTGVRYPGIPDQYRLFFDNVNFSISVDVRCPVCRRDLKGFNKIISHMRSHTGARPFTCPLCKKPYKDPITLNKHLHAHLSSGTYKCDQCPYSCTQSGVLARHKQSKHGTRHNICDICGKAFGHISVLKNHKATAHSRETFRCEHPGCNVIFNSKANLKIHMESHTTHTVSCSLCSYTAKTKRLLQGHMSRQHGSQRFKCDKCSYETKYKGHLGRHMLVHLNMKPYLCPYCDYRCNVFSNLKIHILETGVHERASVFHCNYCAYMCNQASSIKTHLITSHNVAHDHLKDIPKYLGLYDEAGAQQVANVRTPKAKQPRQRSKYTVTSQEGENGTTTTDRPDQIDGVSNPLITQTRLPDIKRELTETASAPRQQKPCPISNAVKDRSNNQDPVQLVTVELHKKPDSARDAISQTLLGDQLRTPARTCPKPQSTVVLSGKQNPLQHIETFTVPPELLPPDLQIYKTISGDTIINLTSTTRVHNQTITQNKSKVSKNLNQFSATSNEETMEPAMEGMHGSVKELPEENTFINAFLGDNVAKIKEETEGSPNQAILGAITDDSSVSEINRSTNKVDSVQAVHNVITQESLTNDQIKQIDVLVKDVHDDVQVGERQMAKNYITQNINQETDHTNTVKYFNMDTNQWEFVTNGSIYDSINQFSMKHTLGESDDPTNRSLNLTKDITEDITETEEQRAKITSETCDVTNNSRSQHECESADVIVERGMSSKAVSDICNSYMPNNNITHEEAEAAAKELLNAELQMEHENTNVIRELCETAEGPGTMDIEVCDPATGISSDDDDDMLDDHIIVKYLSKDGIHMIHVDLV